MTNYGKGGALGSLANDYHTEHTSAGKGLAVRNMIAP